MDYQKANGWLTFAAGAAALAIQIIGALHGITIDWGHAAVSAGVASAGIGHVARSNNGK